MYLPVSCSWDAARPPTSRDQELETVGSWLCDYVLIPKDLTGVFA